MEAAQGPASTTLVDVAAPIASETCSRPPPLPPRAPPPTDPKSAAAIPPPLPPRPAVDSTTPATQLIACEWQDGIAGGIQPTLFYFDVDPDDDEVTAITDVLVGNTLKDRQDATDGAKPPSGKVQEDSGLVGMVSNVGQAILPWNLISSVVQVVNTAATGGQGPGPVNASTAPVTSFVLVIHTDRPDISVMVGKDFVPSWWSPSSPSSPSAFPIPLITSSSTTPAPAYNVQPSAECRVQLPDKTYEITYKVSADLPGRYFVGIQMTSSPMVVMVPLGGASLPKFRIGVLPNSFLIQPADRVACDGFWKACNSVKHLPFDSWAVGSDFEGMPLYAARVKIGDSLHLGMASAKEGVLIPYGGKGIKPPSTSSAASPLAFEILSAIPNTTWLTHLTPEIHPNAVPGGYESDGRPLFLGRASIQRSLFDGRRSLCPGKAGPHIQGCNVVQNWNEVKVVPYDALVLGGPLSWVLDTLTASKRRAAAFASGSGSGSSTPVLGNAPPGVSLASSTISSASSSSLVDVPVEGDPWLPSTGNSIPSTAWHVGADLDGEPLYVARAKVGGTLRIGKLGPNLAAAMFPVKGSEVVVARDLPVEVMARPAGAVWVQYNVKHPFPTNAIGAGFDEEGRVIYVGRGKIQKSLLDRRTTLAPGMAAPHLGGCMIPFNGKEVQLTEYELLVIPKPGYGAGAVAAPGTVTAVEDDYDLLGVSSESLNFTLSKNPDTALDWDDI
ncbi:hypothetical protein HDU96_007143 [Phlyctochytrium bullatum]|nr:hypothetical protein HDU96_007143 [Phlyctochytrium bullatum]